MFERLRSFFQMLGPGLITGAADDDPSGIATYAQTGAQFGYNQLWTALFMLPFMIAVQDACARIGAVTGKGIAANIRRFYSCKLLYIVCACVLIANTINIGADIGAMAASTQLLLPLPFLELACGFAIFMLLLEIILSYKVYARILKWLSVFLLAYPLTVFIVSQPWHYLLLSTFIPHIEFNVPFLFIIIGVFGTTISPYMFFWQASQEVEEEKKSGISRYGKSKISKKYIGHIRLDTVVGMLFSEAATWAIIVTAATVLHQHGVTTISTAADAARALEPLVSSFPNAGFLAKLIFSGGVIGLGLLSVPVLAGSTGYVFAESFHWHEGLSLHFRNGKGFYGIIIFSTLVGLLMNVIGIDPIKALVYTAVINGIVAVPLIFLVGKIAASKKIMGRYKSGLLSNMLIAITFIVLACSILLLLLSSLHIV